MSADNNSRPVLETRNLSVRYGKVEALRGTSISLRAGEIVTASPFVAGQMNRPRSSRFTNRHAPWPSCQITFKRSPRRPRKQNKCPLSGSCRSTSCTQRGQRRETSL